MKYWILFILCIPTNLFSQSVPERNYKYGELFRYRITTEVYRNGKFDSKSETISRHVLYPKKGKLNEQITFIKKTTMTAKDTIINDSVAMSVPPYFVSLEPKGSVLLPPLTIPEMTGDITDLNTFYVAVSPALEAQELSKKKTAISLKELRQGNFADSAVILSGMDCLQVSQKLVEFRPKQTIIETSFAPPANFCLKPLFSAVSSKTGDQFNNIQFVRKAEGDKVNVFWGVETFVIVSTLNNDNGQIEEATMTNTLTLQMRYNAEKDFSGFQAEMPVTIKRVVKLELIDKP